MNVYRLLAPLLSLSIFAVLLLGLDAWTHEPSPGTRRTGFWLMLVGVVVTAGLLVPPFGPSVFFARQMLVWDGLSYFFSWITLLTLLFVALLSHTYGEFKGLRLSAYYALLLLAAAGLIFLVSSNDFLMIFLG